MPNGQPWRFVGFDVCFERWLTIDLPSNDLAYHVANWAFKQLLDPYRSARREPGHLNLWFVPIPGAFLDNGMQVTCSYWIEIADRLLRCNAIAGLNPPFL